MLDTPLQSRRILLRVMLTSLALAAAAGVMGVLIPGKETVWRLVATALITSVGCGLMMVGSRGIEKPETRLGAWAGMGFVLIEYLLGLALLWNIAGLVISSRYGEEKMAMTMIYFAGVGLPAIALVRLLRHPQARIASKVGLLLLGSAFVVIESGTLMYGSAYQNSNVVGAGFVGELYSVGIVACLIGLQKGDRNFFRWIGVTASVVGGAIVIAGILSEGDSRVMLHVATWSTVAAAVIAHANVSLYCELSPGQRWIRPATVLAMLITAVLVGLEVSAKAQDEIVTRLSAAAGICAACGSMAMAIIARMNKKAERPMIAPADISQIAVICPGCQHKQSIPLGESACLECGLRFSIKIDEPRCETCGYLLYRLASDRCPECGTSIATAMTGA